MSELSSVSLTLATMDLALVRMIRGAMRAADAGAGAGCLSPCPVFRHRDVFTPTPRFEPRVVYHPPPRFEPRPVLHPTPRVECKDLCPEPICPEPVRATPSPVKPVWQTLPEVKHPATTPQIKVNLVRPDIRHKGSLIDTFI